MIAKKNKEKRQLDCAKKMKFFWKQSPPHTSWLKYKL